MVGSLPRFVSECSERATSESVKAKQYYDHLYNGMANSPAVVRGAVGSQYEVYIVILKFRFIYLFSCR